MTDADHAASGGAVATTTPTEPRDRIDRDEDATACRSPQPNADDVVAGNPDRRNGSERPLDREFGPTDGAESQGVSID